MNAVATVPYLYALHADEAHMLYSCTTKDEGFLREISSLALIFSLGVSCMFSCCIRNPLLQPLSRNCKLSCLQEGKCTLVQVLRICTGRTTHRGRRGIALLFLDHGTRRWWGVSVTPRALFTPGKDPVPLVQEAGWTPGPVWTGAENLAPTGIRSPDRPARSQSLYRLRYPAHQKMFA